MKKNILTIIVLAATLVNLTLTALMLFVYLPNAQKMNNMITKICQVIDMELENPIVTEKEPEVLPEDDVFSVEEAVPVLPDGVTVSVVGGT